MPGRPTVLLLLVAVLGVGCQSTQAERDNELRDSVRSLIDLWYQRDGSILRTWTIFYGPLPHLDADKVERLEPGLEQERVRELIGRPHRIEKEGGRVVWVWETTFPTSHCSLRVSFRNGKQEGDVEEAWVSLPLFLSDMGGADRLKPGLRFPDVRDEVGEPTSVHTRGKHATWTWHFMGNLKRADEDAFEDWELTPDTYRHSLVVHFEDGKVIGEPRITETKLLK